MSMDINAVLGPTVSNAIWPVSSSATAAVASCTVPAPQSGVRSSHLITGFTVSLSSACLSSATIQLQDGTTNIDTVQLPTNYVGAPILVSYANPYQVTAGNSATLSCTSPGTGVTVWIVLKGKTAAA